MIGGKKITELTLAERREIERMLKEGITAKVIHQQMDRSYTTILAEIKRSGGVDHYNAVKAHKDARERKMNRLGVGRKSWTFSEEQIIMIKHLINDGETAALICKKMKVGRERLYKFFNQQQIDVGHSTRFTVIERLDALEEQVKILSEQVKKHAHYEINS